MYLWGHVYIVKKDDVTWVRAGLPCVVKLTDKESHLDTQALL